MKILLMLITMTTGAQAMDRITALAQVETGMCDTARGQSGEVSRWQITPEVWRRHTNLPLSAAVNPFTAVHVVEIEQAEHVRRFVQSHHRQPTDAEWYGLWSRPARADHLRIAEAERAKRFANLCGRKP